MFEPGKLQHLISTDRATARKVEAAPFTLEHLIAWLETKPPGERYDWYNCNGLCMFGQYGKACGISGSDDAIYNATMNCVGAAIHGAGIACANPHTFGAALQRARAYKARAAQ